MKNYVQPGNNITLAASPYAVDSGEGVLVGQLFGVACGDAANGAEVDIATVGVFDLAKTSAAVFTVGAPVYFDAATQTCRSGNDDDSNSAGDNEALIGVAVAAAGAGATTVRVKLGTPVTLV
jgi:predicted RecA/RadA family phage recombinase